MPELNPELTRFQPAFRLDPFAAFDLERTTTGGGTVPFVVGDRAYPVYRNVNLSVYSGQVCNARCPFCVEELRPASRGTALSLQKRVEPDDTRYFERLDAVLTLTRPLDPTLSITGGEPSLDPRLPGILSRITAHGLRKRTITTNASGLLRPLPGGGDVLDALAAASLAHLNISRAHWDADVNQRVMRIDPPQTEADLRRIVARARDAGMRPRLSCVLLAGVVDDLAACERYLAWAADLGVDNVVFRQLMRYDPRTTAPNGVTRFTDTAAAPLRPLLEALRPSADDRPGHPRFAFNRHVVGYYYAVEVYTYDGNGGPMDVCFEGADLAAIEARRAGSQGADAVDTAIHELVFHADTALCSTWQPWDGRIY
jgi:molybdenum cofactor biosynthesis enzyme MoaA